MNKVDLKKYIGKNYEDYNCFDLVKEFYLDHYGIDIKNYFEGGTVPNRRGVSALIISNKGYFVEVKEPQFGDVVTIKLYGIECHIGVVIHGGLFLHSSKGIGSNADRLSRYSKMIAGYYRHRELA